MVAAKCLPGRRSGGEAMNKRCIVVNILGRWDVIRISHGVTFVLLD